MIWNLLDDKNEYSVSGGRDYILMNDTGFTCA